MTRCADAAKAPHHAPPPKLPHAFCTLAFCAAYSTHAGWTGRINGKGSGEACTHGSAEGMNDARRVLGPWLMRREMLGDDVDGS